MDVLNFLNKDNFQHAYLIEGQHSDAVPEILKFLESIKIETLGNQDFTNIKVDSFKIEDARNLKSLSAEKAVIDSKKIFIISANNFLLEAQNTLLKMFEEPIPNTHFFLVLPDINALLPTFTSRFYVIRKEIDINLKEAEKFIKSSKTERINFLKELLTEQNEEDQEGNEVISLDSTRSRALKFLNALEVTLHSKIVKNLSGLLQPATGTFPAQNSLQSCFKQIFKVRQFLRQPGSSAKSLMESVALIVPNF